MDGVLLSLAVALGLGLIVGLQRESTESSMAGVRTVPLVAVLGCVLWWLDQWTEQGWLALTGLIAVTALTVVANFARWTLGDVEPGMTTEVSLLLMYGVGMLAAHRSFVLALVVGGAVAVLLHAKERLHSVIDRMGESELTGVMHVVLIALVIYPVLPDRTLGPYDVLNPSQIWRMVVLVSGISLVAYLVHRALGATRGAIAAGITGGLISSTATTVSYARRARSLSPWTATLVVLLASVMTNFRVLFELAVVNRPLLSVAVGPILGLSVVMLGLALFALIRSRSEATESLGEQGNPAQLGAALIFGLLYALILLVVAATRDRFGELALLPVAVLSGLTDVDAITLSTARLHSDGGVTAGTARRVVITALASNLAFKGGVVAVLGSATLRRRALPLFGLSVVAAVLLVVLWPAVGAS